MNSPSLFCFRPNTAATGAALVVVGSIELLTVFPSEIFCADLKPVIPRECSLEELMHPVEVRICAGVHFKQVVCACHIFPIRDSFIYPGNGWKTEHAHRQVSTVPKRLPEDLDFPAGLRNASGMDLLHSSLIILRVDLSFPATA